MSHSAPSRMQLHPNNFTIFVNGWVISLGLGYGHMCANRDLVKAGLRRVNLVGSLPPTPDAEVCVWLEGSTRHVQLGFSQSEDGFIPVDLVLDLIQKLRTTPPEVESFQSVEDWWKEY